MRNATRSLMALLLIVCTLSRVCSGYSVLTHEEIVDLLLGRSDQALVAGEVSRHFH